MVLRYRVSLPGIKGFARVYEVKDTTTLYYLHKQMRADMDFPQDQMVLFKSQGETGAVVTRYGIFNLGAGTIDSVTFGQTYRKGEVTFIYFYDTTNAKSVIVTCEGPVEERKGVIYPVLVESKGPNPVEFENGYVAFEDLPDEKRRSIQTGETDDEDLEEDDDSDSDTEEIYDEDQEDE